MHAKTKKVNATTTNGESIRLAIPYEQWNETTAGHREVSTGIIRIGHNNGRRWGVVHDYSIWTKRNGEVDGDVFSAYDLTNKSDRREYALILADAHPIDLVTGNVWMDAKGLLTGACYRPVTEDESGWLARNGYSDDEYDLEHATVLAEKSGGARFYHIPNGGFAVESETGEGFIELDMAEAINIWE